MAISQTDASTLRKPLRLWPGVALVILMLLLRFVVPAVAPSAATVGLFGWLLGSVVVLLWWLFFSRAPGSDRLISIAVIAAGLVVTKPLLDKSIATGAMGMLFYVLAVPFLAMALVAAAAAGRRLPTGPRRALMAGAILLACLGWTLIRTGGFDSDGNNDFAWRWSPTPEDLLLAEEAGEPLPAPPVPAVAAAGAAAPEVPAQAAAPEGTPASPAAAEGGAAGEPAAALSNIDDIAEVKAAAAAPAAVETTGADWPGFRGPRRDGLVRGARIATDWSASPPVEIWRRPVGPGWSSFAVQGKLVYTQEQRGEEEAVSCYNLTTGEPVWRHVDAARFWESNAGAGPRATPTLANGRVYTLGATGILNALDARDGSVVWSRNTVADTGAEIPGWGISGSPLVVDGLVIAAVNSALAAYDAATGTPRWTLPASGSSYASPHLATVGGVRQVLMLNGDGAVSVTPADGKVLWEHAWKGYPIVQPALTADGDVLISVGDKKGIRRLHAAAGAGGWTVEERWTSIGLKPYFNDFVVHEGHALGFDGAMLSCIDLADGKKKWKDGRYGHGQLVLLPDQDLLLVLSEQGELALVEASTGQFKEVARFPALEGKTWNHPVVAGGVLLVRNDEEMAAFRLPLAARLTEDAAR